ncbi:hypothetical protein [uncultured Kordia sp.]|uniref:hypothetical protein n=1 Tax=uncultured Kordia sp. TaxID=507699 RepID=UPI0026355470|nr:hypothetical protein [uncultured Kordia sp.]
MKNLWFLFALVFVFGCDDGDLPLEEIDFESTASVAGCTPVPAGVTLLFRIDGAEALILEVPNTLFINTVTDEGIPRELDLSVSGSAYYRGFNTTISSDYFCSELPPSDIQVNLEYTANNGIVKVVTTEVPDTVDPTIIVSYQHVITFENIVFSNNEGNSITYDTFDYGSITTVAE